MLFHLAKALSSSKSSQTFKANQRTLTSSEYSSGNRRMKNVRKIGHMHCENNLIKVNTRKPTWVDVGQKEMETGHRRESNIRHT